MATQLPLTIIKIRPSSYVIIRPGKQPESYDFNQVKNPLQFLDDLDMEKQDDQDPVQDNFNVNMDNIDNMDNYSRISHSMRPYEKNNLWDTFRNVDDFGDDEDESYISDEEGSNEAELTSILQYLEQLQSNDDNEQDMPDDETNTTLDGSETDDHELFGSNVANNSEDSQDNVDADQDNQDFQGIIRSIKGAALVYKREDPNGTFEELWVYNVGKNLKDETQIRRFILANTDINPNTQISDDGTQKAKTYSVGNVQFLHISGLPQ